MKLYEKDESIIYYEDRYSKGYMDEWDIAKKERVFEIIKCLNLPDTGKLLDFGCGTGVFTNIIKRILPFWEVYGADIAPSAIEKARERYKDCTFYNLSDNRLKNLKFDFIFTHHVLEHVYDINEVLKQINNYMKPSSSCLHILPCSNEGSLEYKICLLINDGINMKKEGRFYCDEEGHVRRLNTDKLNSLLLPYGFTLSKEYYANQYYGSIKYIVENKERLSRHTDLSNSKDSESFKKLMMIKVWLYLVYFLILPANYIKNSQYINLNLKRFIISVMAFCLYPISKPINYYLSYKAKQEWDMRKMDKNGSEMYLFYERKVA